MIHYDHTQLPTQTVVYAHRVFDGDTLRLSGSTYTGIVRIWGIDAPEHGQPYFREARDHLRSLTDHVALTIIPVTWDRYNRLIAKILGHSYLDIGLHMIAAGSAWHENLHAPTAHDYRDAHHAAHRAKIGLWACPPPHVPPWLFRRHTSINPT
jgi:endonuclease YncB( thermonuclease family)